MTFSEIHYRYLKGLMRMEERCICCGRIIPEGHQVCMICEKKTYQGNRTKRRFHLFRKKVKKREQYQAGR